MLSMSQAWDKENIWVPDKIRTCDLPNIGFGQTDCVSQWLANCLYQKLSGWLAEMYNLLIQFLTDINWLSDCPNGSGTLKLIGIFAIMNDHVV